MFGILRGEGLAVCQLEIGEVETGGDGATYQCVFAAWCGRRGKPTACADDGLKGLAFFEVATQPVYLEPTVVSNLIDPKRVAIIEVPKLVRGDPVKGRELARTQEKIDTC